MSEFEFWKDIGNISEAILTYQRKNAEFNNRFINPWIGLGNLSDNKDHNLKAVQAYENAAKIDPNNFEHWVNLGDAQLKLCAYAEAATAYRKAVELDPYAGYPLGNLALSLVMQDKIDEAIPLYLASIERLSDDKEKAMIWNRLGEAYRKLNNYEKAFLSFQKADRLEDKGSSRVVSEVPQKTNTIEQTGIPDEPEPDESANDDDDDDDNPLANFNRHYAGKPHSDILAPKVERSPSANLSTDPFESIETSGESESRAFEALPDWLSEDHKNLLTGNEKKYMRVPDWLETNPNSEVNVMGLADQFYMEQDAEDEKWDSSSQEKDSAPKNSADKEQARQMHEQAYEEYLRDVINPINDLPDHMDEVTSQTKVHSKGETLKSMETRNAQVWNELGNVYMKSGSYDDAIAAYQKAIEMERTFAWPYSNLALAFVQKGFYSEAVHLYQRSIELFVSDKDKAITWNRLGKAYRCMNDYPNAIIAYRTADELDPENVTTALRSSFGLLGDIHNDLNLVPAS